MHRDPSPAGDPGGRGPAAGQGVWAGGQGRILIVDDDEDLRALVSNRLTRQGYRVVAVADAQAAFEAVSACIPDLILLDVNLPDLSGYEISRRLKGEMLQGIFVPIVFVTGQGEMPEKLKGFEAGADDYLVKPFNADELDARIRSMLKIKRLQDDLREANRKLKALQELKDHLTHLLVHDLRLPLSNLLVAVQRLLKGSERTLTEEETRLGRVVEDSGRSLVEMIDNILDVAAMEEGRMPLHRETVNVKELLSECLESLADASRYRKIRLQARLADPPSLEADNKMLRRAVTNLLWNALKLSPPGGTVTLVCETRPGSVRIAVEDEAAVIPPEQRAKVFDQYFQAEASRQGRPVGVGFGLVYCRLVAESHGGSIAVEPLPKGNRFVLQLPA